MRKLSIIAAWFVALVIGASTPAMAAPITASAGDTLIFNFDLTGQTPAPPYVSVDIDLGLGAYDLGLDQGSWNALVGLNGTGTSIGPFSVATPSVTFSSFSGLNDGLFSIVLTMTAGQVTFDPFAVGYLGPFATGTSTPRVGGTLAAAPVPEPASMFLLGSGLAGLVVRARRRKQQQIQ